MPLTADSVLQTKTGTGSGGATSNFTVSLDSATQSGSAVLVFTAIAGDGSVDDWNIGAVTAGFTLCGPSSVGTSRKGTMDAFYKLNTSSESSWTFQVQGGAGSQPFVWIAIELANFGLDPLEAYFVNTPNASGNNTAVSSRDSGTPDPWTCYNVLAFSIHIGQTDTTTAPTLSGHTNSFTELVQAANNGASRSIAISVGTKTSLSINDTLSSTASSSPNSAMHGGVVVLYGDGAKFAPAIEVMTGFEFGTVTGITNGSEAIGNNNQSAPFNVSTGSPEIVTNIKRSGVYALKLSASAAAECLTWENPGTLSAISGLPLVRRGHFYFETSLPSADVELYSVEAGSLTNGVTIWYRNSSQKIGVKVGTGTEVLSDTTVSTNTWIGIDFRYDTRTTTHKCDWQLVYDANTSTPSAPVVQTQSSNTGMTVANISKVRIGWSTAKTATVYYDDELLSYQWGAYPLGDMRIEILTPDGSNLPSIVGTSSNFQTFASNGTGTAWNATTAKNAIDDIPPTVGSSSDGVMQITTASNDYIHIPLTTKTCAPLFVPRAIRCYVDIWAASGTAATLAVKSYEGTTLIRDQAALDHGADASAHRWNCWMHVWGNAGYYQITQQRLDDLAIRVGGSTDAAPDVGAHAVFAEFAFAPVQTVIAAEAEDGNFKLYARYDENNSGLVSFAVATPAGTRGATLVYALNGVDQTPVNPGPNTLQEYPVGASDILTVTGWSFTPDPA